MKVGSTRALATALRAFCVAILLYASGTAAPGREATLPRDAQADGKHWAYVEPARRPPPAVRHTAWPRNPIDAFVLSRIERAGWTPSPAENPARLLRRARFDTTGLPPEPGEIDRFLADLRPDAYERELDRLFASPAFGENWARPWLDLARHADSNGFQRDGHREVWAFRDWVIRAINADMPFDRFTIEQIAGDLLPSPTLEERIATGFHRSTTVNVEAGTDPEENRVNAVFDRVETTATVWLGTTLECARCHDHKYDPFTQRDYYRLFAYFNNTAVETSEGPNSVREFIGPKIELPWTMGGKKGKPATALVMVELPEPRETRIFRRGDFLHPGERVEPGVPEVLHPLPDGAPPNRLGLARWLVSPRNALVARVTVNRWWAEVFGRGIVTTLGDFGTRGARPTHPELLDWLAVEFVEGGWSRKRILRLLLSSATYRQAARMRPEIAERDPQNAFLARGPRVRLSAEAIRDRALHAAGLLSRKMFGPPAYPPQPPGIWDVTGKVDNTYPESRGEERYRRGIYTVWRRSSPYPSFVHFDAPDRSVCTVRRPTTNTPLQALTLLNDPVYVEAAQALACRTVRECAVQGLSSAAAAAEQAFRLVLGRKPEREELELLQAIYTREKSRLERDPQAATALLGPYACGGGERRAREGACFFLAAILLNLDEAIHK